jgi:hypothetical protein
MGDMGSIECCGVTVPVGSLRIEGGNLVVTGRRNGPVRAVAGPVTISGPDGIAFARGGRFACEAAGRGERLTWELTLYPDSPECFPVIPGEVLPAAAKAIGG